MSEPLDATATDPSPPSRCRQCQREVEPGRAFCESCGTRVVTQPGTKGPPEEKDPFLGMTLKGRYRVLRRLGAGSMGTVYEATHLALQKSVAVKILHPSLQLSEDAVRRFQQEGVIAGRFHHQGAIEVFDFDRDESGAVFLAMERIVGRTLRQVMEEEGTYAPRAAVDLMIHILEVLAAAHDEGIIHRDLKPDNVMLVDAPTPEASVKVLDFGVSKILDFHNENTLLTRTGQILGTPLYMSPEQCAGDDVDVRSDVYASGLLLFELIVGQPPFSGRNLTELLMKHATGSIPSLADACPDQEIPVDLERIVARALQKDPERRFATAAELLEALREVRYERVVSQSPLGRLGRQLGRGVRRHPGRIAAAVALLALVGAATWAILRPPAGNGGDRTAGAGVALESAEVRYQRQLGQAQDAVLKGDAAGALGVLELALQDREFLDAEGHLVRGRAYELQGDLGGARADFQEARDQRPEWSAPLCAMGWLEQGRGNFLEAGALFEQARLVDDGAAEAYAGLAALALDAEEWETGRELLEQAQSRDDRYWRVHLLWGRWHLAGGAEEEALAALEEARLLQPRDPEVFVALSRVHERLGDPDQAELMAEQAVRLNPDLRDAALRRAFVALQRGRFPDATLFLGDWLRRHPEDAEMQLLLAVAHCEQGKEGEALDLLRQSLGQSPRQVEAWVLRGTLEHGLGMLAEAVESYQSALILEKEHSGAHRNLGLLYMQRQQFELAAEHLERAAMAEGDPELLHALGVLYWEYLGDTRAGRDWFRQYRDSGGQDPRALDIAGPG